MSESKRGGDQYYHIPVRVARELITLLRDNVDIWMTLTEALPQ
jgi:hypothetical protein